MSTFKNECYTFIEDINKSVLDLKGKINSAGLPQNLTFILQDLNDILDLAFSFQVDANIHFSAECRSRLSDENVDRKCGVKTMQTSNKPTVYNQLQVGLPFGAECRPRSNDGNVDCKGDVKTMQTSMKPTVYRQLQVPFCDSNTLSIKLEQQNDDFVEIIESHQLKPELRNELKGLTMHGGSNPQLPKKRLCEVDFFSELVNSRKLKVPSLDKGVTPFRSGRFPFETEGDRVVAYVDGACTQNGRANPKGGVGVWFYNDCPYNVSETLKRRRTSNTAEFTASKRAIEQAYAAGFRKLLIKTDSMFVIQCMTVWRHKWERKGWLTSDGRPVINKNDVVSIAQAMANTGVDVEWEHVKAHIGIVGNEAADFLAKKGAKNKS